MSWRRLVDKPSCLQKFFAMVFGKRMDRSCMDVTLVCYVWQGSLYVVDRVEDPNWKNS